MFPRRSLLYHRGIDDSIGTYVTDYVLVAECFILLFVLLLRFVKAFGVTHLKSDFPKSTVAVALILGGVGSAALIGGLVHQFVQTVEPYHDWHDAMGWLVVWRIAAALSGFVSFGFFMLIEYLLTTENDLKPSARVRGVYYVIAAVYSVGLIVYSVYTIFHKTNPWSLTTTFLLVSVAMILEEAAILYVLIKKKFFNSSLRESASRISEKSFASENSGSRTGNEVKFYNDGPSERNEKESEKRWDLWFHFLATTSFLLGGLVQLIFGKLFFCGQDEGMSHKCPLPDTFNHNSIFHVLQMVAMAAYFAAEWFAIGRRKQSNSTIASNF